MENVHLSRRADAVKYTIDSVIDELIAEIEEKENLIKALEERIDDLEEQNEELRDRISF